MKRVVFLYTHPIQYFAPLHQELNKSNICKHIVLFCENTTEGYYDQEFGKRINWDIPLTSGYNFNFLKKSWISILGSFFKYSNFSIAKYLHREETDILIVHGWNYFTAIYAIIIAKTSGVKVWLRAENPYIQEVEKTIFKKYLKKLFLQFGLFKLINKFLYIGQQNKLFYKNFGVKDDRLIFTPYCVDNDRLTKLNSELGPPHQMKNEIGVFQDRFMVLFSGKLIEKKNPMDLLKAFHIASLKKGTLIFLGDGILLNSLKIYVNEHKLNNVIFAGFKNQSELPKYYKAADVFVLPSGNGETWGLVVNEAMNFSLPIITSDRVGSASDLVVTNKNGFTYPLGDVKELARLLNRIELDAEWRKKAGEYSKELIKSYSYPVIINNLKLTLSK
ncbi:MAG TPA: glycosyltransferase family 4 protein [Saprospiraceae bacterium]|nr:glycosyltransferase family 4 protein [Saprospiraceae bacterium]